MTHVPFIDLRPLTRQIARDAQADFSAILDTCEFVEGSYVRALEARLQADLGVAHAVACASGSDALILALWAAGVTPGMKVALPNLTFWATYEAIVHVGALPVLIDIDPDDLQMSFDAFQKAHDLHRFDAAILVHLFGWASRQLDEFRALCTHRSILLVEDAAQAYGVKSAGRPLLAQAHLATLSFYPAKVIGGVMDGGAVVTDSEAHAHLLRSLRNHGRTNHYSYAHVGLNSRMSGIQGAYLLRVCAMSEAIIAARKRAAQYYDDLFAHHSHIQVHVPPRNIDGNGYLNVITCEGKSGESLHSLLTRAGIGAARTYPETIDAQAPAKHAIVYGDLGVSRAFCTRVINLPLYYGIEIAQCDQAARALLAAYFS